jgi:predicted nucleic acid-binding protein
MRLVLLDTGPLGLATNPQESAEALRCNEWLSAMTYDAQILVPEIADYELRRELVREGLAPAIQRLDDLIDRFGYLPVTTAVWRRAAELWAHAGNEGYPAAADAALDGDMLLAAQAQLAAEAGHDVVVATTNVKHLDRFTVAELWESIVP